MLISGTQPESITTTSKVPVLVVYGDHDWSRPDERQRTVAAIPMAKIETVPDGGHFLSLDRPQRLAEMIMSFAKG